MSPIRLSRYEAVPVPVAGFPGEFSGCVCRWLVINVTAWFFKLSGLGSLLVQGASAPQL